MSKGFCTHCGAQLAEKADFCNNCGAQIEMINGVPAAKPIKTDPYPDSAPLIQPVTSAQTYVPPKGPRPIKQRPKIIGFAIGAIFLITVPFIVFAALGFLNFSVIGTLDFEVDSFAETNVILDIDNDVGSVEIVYDPTLTTLLEATLEVLGRPGSELEDAVNFELTNDTVGEITVSFESGDRVFWYWDKETFNYNIVVYIHPTAVVDYNIDAGTGSISFDTDSEDDLAIENISLDSGTGTVTLDMAGSVNSSVEGLYINTGTGSINANLGTSTSLNTSVVNIHAGTGSITFAYEDLIVNDDITLVLDAGTGSINMDITQNAVLPFTYETTILAESGTGSITLDLTLDSSIGSKITADTGTGSISIFGSENDHESANYSTADNIYTIVLDTGTGSINVT